jgi:hypothetical protein
VDVSDAIYYGIDLADYLKREFGGIKVLLDRRPTYVAF